MTNPLQPPKPSFLPPMRFSTPLLLDWLRPQVTSTGAAVLAGDPPPSKPHRVICIAMQPGAGLTHEQLFDRPAFQITCRGAENNYADAEAIALYVDEVLLNQEENFWIGDEDAEEGVWCNMVDHLGGGPRQMTRPDSQARYLFTCNYVVQVSR